MHSRMASATPISDSESVVMEVLWDAARPVTCEDVVRALAQRTDWQEATVKTFLGRLLRKGAVRAVKDGRRYRYSPVLTRQRWLSVESRRLVKRLFGGRIAPLVAHFGAHHRLSREDLAELRRVVAALDDHDG
jgi:BlaI family transcriptional regulator, penicillinase repressor